jgi:hypothetical protein
VIFEY